MQVKNRISLTRKTIYGMLLLLWLFLSAFVAGRMNLHKDASVTATPIMPVQVTVVVGPGTEMSIEEMQTREASLNNTHLKGPTLSPLVPSQTAQSPQRGLILAGLIGLAALVGAGLWVVLKRRKRGN